MSNFFTIKWYKTYKNWLRVTKVIVKNKMSHFLWFTVYMFQIYFVLTAKNDLVVTFSRYVNMPYRSSQAFVT